MWPSLLMLLVSRVPCTAGRLGAPELEPRVLQEQNSHTVHIHRAEPKFSNINGPCSTSVEIAEGMSVSDILHLVQERLEFPASRLEWQGAVISSSRLHRLPDETVLDVYEHRPDVHGPRPEQQELRRLQTFEMAYAPEEARALQEVNIATLCPVSALRAWNCSRCSTSSFAFRPNETHVVVGEDSSLLAIIAPDHRRRWIVVALRGTVDSIVLDWILDLEWQLVPLALGPRWPDSFVHSGFLKGWNQLKPHVMKACGKLQADWPSYRLKITGHSLGASMASLMAASLLASPDSDRHQPFDVVTFGEPRTGNRAFAAAYTHALGAERQHFRCVHANDIIPHYPFREIPGDVDAMLEYHHTAQEIWLYENSTAHRVCDGSGEDEACSDSVPLSRWSGADHTSYFGLDAGPCQN